MQVMKRFHLFLLVLWSVISISLSQEIIFRPQSPIPKPQDLSPQQRIDRMFRNVEDLIHQIASIRYRLSEFGIYSLLDQETFNDLDEEFRHLLNMIHAEIETQRNQKSAIANLDKYQQWLDKDRKWIEAVKYQLDQHTVAVLANSTRIVILL